MQGIKDFVTTLPDSHLLKRLLTADCPNVLLPITHSAELAASLHRCIEQWEFIGHFFRLAYADKRFPIPLMPLIAYLTLQTKQVPSVDRITEIVSPFVSGDCEPRIYSCYTAWLRELDVALYLAGYGTVTKPLLLDLTEGVDLLYEGKRLAITHKGDKYLSRKQSKYTGDVIVLEASGDQGLHRVSRDSLAAVISATARK